MDPTAEVYHDPATPHTGEAFAEVAETMLCHARALLDRGDARAAAAHVLFLAGRALAQLQASLRGAP